MELKQPPTLRSFGLTRRTLICHPVPASIPLQEQDTLLPAAASCKQEPQSGHHLPVLARPAAACPSPTQSPRVCICPAQVKDVGDLQLCRLCCKLSVLTNETRSQERALATVPLILWLWCFPEKLPYWYTLVYSEAPELWMCFSKKHKLITANVKLTRESYSSFSVRPTWVVMVSEKHSFHSLTWRIYII